MWTAMVEVDDVAGPHADATEGCRFADPAFLGCSVDVNATIARFLVLRFHSSEPDHARNNWVTFRPIYAHDFTCRNPILNDRASRQSIADFCSNE
jgi:hypothetical protein